MPVAHPKTTNKNKAGTPSRSGDAARRKSPPESESIRPEKENSVTADNSSWLNWDVIGISTTAVTLAGAAIFFVSGWFYEARWYGFYGLNISQLRLSPIDFMVQGIPGIMVFLIAFLISWVVIRVSKVFFRAFWLFRLEGDAPGVAFLNVILRNELVWIGLLAYLLLALLDLVAEVVLTLSFRQAYQTSYLTLAGIVATFVIVLFMILSLGPIRSSKLLYLAAFTYFEHFFHDRETGLEEALGSVFRVLTVFVLVLTFILSISLSSILGQYDAIGHKRSLSGWFVPQTMITSQEEIPMLENYRVVDKPAGDRFAYETFGLVAADDEKYYLVEYETDRYRLHPVVYTVDRQSVDLSFVIRDAAYVFNPEDQPTATPMSTPTPAVTPTADPSATPAP
jgi:hypothetical protein